MKIKAIRVRSFGGPEVMKTEETELPEPGPKEVIVRLKTAGVNPVDTYQREASRGYSPELPFTPGLDGSGIVAAAGKDVRRVREGDRVYLAGSLTGTYAEAALCREETVFPLPPALDFRQGAALFVNYFTAFRGLFQRGGLTPGEKVLIHGASGGVGIAALQGLAWKGTAAAATAGTAEGIELTKQQGAAFAVNHREESHWDELSKWSGGGFDLILEMAANINLDRDPSLLAPGGRIVIIGSGGETSLNPRDLMKIDGDIRGMVLLNTSAAERNRIADMLAEASGDGFINPVIRMTFPLSQAADAHRLVREPGAMGKILLEI